MNSNLIRNKNYDDIVFHIRHESINLTEITDIFQKYHGMIQPTQENVRVRTTTLLARYYGARRSRSNNQEDLQIQIRNRIINR